MARIKLCLQTIADLPEPLSPTKAKSCKSDFCPAAQADKASEVDHTIGARVQPVQGEVQMIQSLKGACHGMSLKQTKATGMT